MDIEKQREELLKNMKKNISKDLLSSIEEVSKFTVSPLKEEIKFKVEIR